MEIRSASGKFLETHLWNFSYQLRHNNITDLLISKVKFQLFSMSYIYLLQSQLFEIPPLSHKKLIHYFLSIHSITVGVI